jgi:hypothetical protein
VYTVDGHRVPKKKRSSGAKLAIGECKRVVTGRDRKCTIEFCHTGKGRTGYGFSKGTRRCGR